MKLEISKYDRSEIWDEDVRELQFCDAHFWLALMRASLIEQPEKLVYSVFRFFNFFDWKTGLPRDDPGLWISPSEKSFTAVNRRKPPKLAKHKTQLILVSFLAAFYITWRRQRCQATHVTVKHCHVIMKKASVNVPVKFAPGKWCVSGF